MIDALQKRDRNGCAGERNHFGVTVAENIFLAELSQFRNKLGMINKKGNEPESDRGNESH